MKKTYKNPEIEVIKMKMNQQLLDGSKLVEVDPEEKSGGDAVGHYDEFDW